MYRIGLIIFLTLLNKIGSGEAVSYQHSADSARVGPDFIVRIAPGQLLAIACKPIGTLSPIFSD
jgi:hypothetical protein